MNPPSWLGRPVPVWRGTGSAAALSLVSFLGEPEVSGDQRSDDLLVGRRVERPGLQLLDRRHRQSEQIRHLGLGDLHGLANPKKFSPLHPFARSLTLVPSPVSEGTELAGGSGSLSPACIAAFVGPGESGSRCH